MTIEQAARKAAAALRRARMNPTTLTLRAAARAVVDVRSMFECDGRPDWRGRSAEYRAVAQEMYRAAGIEADSVSPFQSKVRYHVGVALRDRASAEDLEALDLHPVKPSARAARARRRRTAPQPARPANDTTALVLIDHAIADIRLLRTLPDDHRSDVAPQLRALVQEVFDVIADAY